MHAILGLLAILIQHPASGEELQPLPADQQVGLPRREALRFEGERRLGTIRRLTTGGENAEGYFNWAGDRISYQATVGDRECDQIYVLDLITGARQMVSTGAGRTTCAYFMPDDRSVVFASTHAADPGCLPPPDRTLGYVWKIYPEYDLWVRDLRTQELSPLAHAPGYDAEATVSPDGQKIVFCSRRNGDLDIYSMNLDGTELKQLTDELGYDGGPFFSPDGQKIVYRAYHPQTEEERSTYEELLAQDSIRPMALQIMVMDADGSNKRRITDNGYANFAPYFHPSGEKIIYCSNESSGGGRGFDIYLIDLDGTNKERVTFNPSFDGFPMFSHDGKRLIFASNRENTGPYDTNLFIAEWFDDPPAERPLLGSR